MRAARVQPRQLSGKGMPAAGLAVVTGTTALLCSALYPLQGGSGCWDFLGAVCQVERRWQVLLGGRALGCGGGQLLRQKAQTSHTFLLEGEVGG